MDVTQFKPGGTQYAIADVVLVPLSRAVATNPIAMPATVPAQPAANLTVPSAVQTASFTVQSAPATNQTVPSADQWVSPADVSSTPIPVPAMPGMPSMETTAQASQAFLATSPESSSAPLGFSAVSSGLLAGPPAVLPMPAAIHTASDTKQSDVKNTYASAPASPTGARPANNPLDGGHLPKWIVDSLIQPASANSARQNAAQPGAAQP
jgi:hypothetical protein